MLNKNLYHFSTLATYSAVDFKTFAEELQQLNSQFPKIFEDFRKQEVNLDIFSSPFSVDVKKVLLFLQIGLIELHENTCLKNTFQDVKLVEFYQKYLIINRTYLLVKEKKIYIFMFLRPYAKFNILLITAFYCKILSFKTKS